MRAVGHSAVKLIKFAFKLHISDLISLCTNYGVIMKSGSPEAGIPQDDSQIVGLLDNERIKDVKIKLDLGKSQVVADSREETNQGQTVRLTEAQKQQKIAENIAKYNKKVMDKFKIEMQYNPTMFLWKNSTDLDYISDIMKLLDQGIYVLLLIYVVLIVIYVGLLLTN